MTELSALDVDLGNERPGSVLDRSLSLPLSLLFHVLRRFPTIIIILTSPPLSSSIGSFMGCDLPENNLQLNLHRQHIDRNGSPPHIYHSIYCNIETYDDKRFDHHVISSGFSTIISWFATLMLHFWIPKKWTIRDWIIGKHHIHCHHCPDQVGLLLLPCTDDNSENPVCTCKVFLEMHLQGLLRLVCSGACSARSNTGTTKILQAVSQRTRNI